MSEWKVSMNVREIRLLDSQDMDYSVKLQKLNKITIATAKRQLHQHELFNATQLRPCWETSKEIIK
jgi:hypothetical protein